MATRAETDLKVERELKSLRLFLETLPELAREWQDLGDGERASWSRDWDQLMGAVEVVLHPRYLSGAMTINQRTRYCELLSKIDQARPLIRQLNLYSPLVPLDNVG
ncbi:MAG: hypothetical protein HY690_19610 [Chloroflexi bacterium]|nr:hypothetical protein [Chloroflexota bacterium]